MTVLWRCDVCRDLIDPTDGDERATLSTELDHPEKDAERHRLDLCEGCRPSDVSAHVEWMVHMMDREGPA